MRGTIRFGGDGLGEVAPERLVIATAGHVDHGKSTLVRALTGVDPDRWDEEKQRGMTIDLGFGAATLPTGRELAFVDVPGHVRFIKNMLAGVGAVDACLFVVAATEGWKPPATKSENRFKAVQQACFSRLPPMVAGRFNARRTARLR